MRPARRRRTAEAVALSVAVHAVLIAAVAVWAPRLRLPPPERGPPEAVIPVLIMPRTPPAAANPTSSPSPIRLHQRQLRPDRDETPVKPLVVPQVEAPAPPAPTPAPKLVAPAPPAPVAANGQRALRGLLGCANANLVDLTREERQKCEDQLAAGARGAPYLGSGVEAGKARGLAGEAARNQADYNYKHGVKPSAPAQGQVPWDGYRGPPGQAEALGAKLGNDKPTGVVPRTPF